MAMASLNVPMITTTISLYFFSLLLFSKAHLSLPLPRQSNTDIHELLPQYGLPRGLLPNNVESYTLSPSGSFSVHLTSPCYVHFDELVYYDKEITGQLTYGSVHDVVGIQAKKIFVWVPVTGIEVSKDVDGMIKFFVGPFSEDLPAKQFDDVPACKAKAGVSSGLESI